MNEALIREIVASVALEFSTFGGGRVIPNNPISLALSDSPPMFTAGVDVEKVVRFIVSKTVR